jgi:penicillin amidase
MSFLHSLVGPPLRAGLTRLSRQRLPQTEGTLALPGLSADVEIIRDRWGVPHIYAANARDLHFALGFVHAQDRLWQMELNRRTALGRLSELFGELALDTDRAVRTFGFNRLDRADWEAAGGEVQQAFVAYAEGVNAFLSQPGVKLPVEFTLLGHRPEPWRPEDGVAFSRVMIWQLSHAWYGEIVRAQLAEAVGEEHAAELEIHYPPTNPITLPAGIEFNALGPEGRLQKAAGPFLARGLGSNAWAISAGRSATGHAFLCNDMHLPVGVPALWYQAHLVGGGLEVTGVTLPGLPLVLVGHNARIAWGMTLAFTDCEDLFVEQFDPEGPDRYRYQDAWLEAEVITEPIPVKGRLEPHLEQVIITRHGPIISDVVGYPEQRVAVRSMALQPGPMLKGWHRLNHAAGWDDFVEAVQLIEAPQLNVAYADVEGNIGYWVTGKVPVRAKGDGRVPVPGWTGEYEWEGEVPFAEMPHALNPAQGYVVTCNHRIVPEDYPHFLGEVWMNGYRARRIEDAFRSKEKLAAEDFRALHTDFLSLPGQEFVAALDGLESADSDVGLALQLLRGWDGQLTPDSVGGTVYQVARYTLVRNLLEPGLGPELASRLMGQAFHPVLLSAAEFYGHDTTTMLRLLSDPDSWWIRQAGGREALITKSLGEAVGWLRAKLGADPAGWGWGRIHRVTFGHPLALQKPLDQVFNLGPFPVGGDTDTVCQMAMAPADPYDCTEWAPSFRQIVDMGDLDRSLVMVPPGQSGQLGSPHYGDLAPLWLRGEYQTMLWTREQVEREGKSKLTLKAQSQ